MIGRRLWHGAVLSTMVLAAGSAAWNTAATLEQVTALRAELLRMEKSMQEHYTEWFYAAPNGQPVKTWVRTERKPGDGETDAEFAKRHYDAVDAAQAAKPPVPPPDPTAD